MPTEEKDFIHVDQAPGELEVLVRIANAIADGRPVDWDQELQDSPGQESVVRQLRDLESITSFHSPSGRAESQTEPLERPLGSAHHEDPPRTWGRLAVSELIGTGAFAGVFRARDATLQRDVALKLPWAGVEEEDPSFSKRFLQEIRRLAQIRHPHIVEVYGANQHDGRLGMWMELLEGQDLEARLNEQGPLSAQEAALIAIDLCGALAAIHAEKLVHRDIKAANVMRVEGGRIVLMDFSSVVEHQEEGGVDDASTRGTPFYMAPEVLDGGDATTASDIYSLGVLLYRLVSGHYPVEADDLLELTQKISRGEIRELLDERPDLPASFVEVVNRALAIPPSERFQTAGEMSHALSLFVSGARSDESKSGRDKRSRGRFWKTAAAAALVVVGAVVAFLALRPEALPPLTVDVELFRKGDLGDESLAPGSQLALGDLLFLEVEASQPVYTYVLNEDAKGRRLVLFPMSGLALENPLAADVRHWLPGPAAGVAEDDASAGRYWQVDSAGGEETMLLIAALRPLEDLESRISEIARRVSSEELEEAQKEASEFRGIGGVAPGDDRQTVTFAGLTAELKEEYREEIQIWRIRLGNPPVSQQK